MDALRITDAAMQGAAKYHEWRREFISSWNEAVQKGQIRQAWAMMPPQMKEWIKQNDPEGYKLVLSVVEKE